MSGYSQGWSGGPARAGIRLSAPAGFCLSSAAALLRSVSLPRSPGLQGPERTRLPRPRQPRAGKGPRGCSADGSARPGAGGGICSPCCSGRRRRRGPTARSHPPASGLLRPQPAGTLRRGEVGAGPGERGDLRVWGLGRCGRDPLGTSRDARRGGWAQRRTCRWRENRGVESVTHPRKGPTDSSDKLLNIIKGFFFFLN